MDFTFAHFSDPHLALPPALPRPFTLLLNKRLSGYLSWRRRRHLYHRAEVLTALQADVADAAPNHVLVTGDLVNLALPAEFIAARAWLESLGAPDEVTVVPGNHDLFVEVPWAQGAGQWEPWMRGDSDENAGFPFLRRRGPVAFVGLSSALPTPPFSATGALGPDQVRRAESLLAELDEQDLFRVVLLHHPPEDRPTKPRKALVDRAALQGALARTGAELVLHGHQHYSRFGFLEGPRGKVPVLGVPSASMTLDAPKGEPARWNLFRVAREGDGWSLAVTIRGLTERGFETLGRWDLTGPADIRRHSGIPLMGEI